MYSYDDLLLFTKVVEFGNFTHTAKMLKVSHTTVSRRIKNLEQQLGVTLLRMSATSFEVTSIGQQIHDTFIEDSRHIDERVRNIIKTKREPQGALNILLPIIMPLRLITPYIPLFYRKYPKINLNFCFQNKEIDLIKEGFDIAILNHIPKQQNQTIKNIFNSQAKLYCTAMYAEKYGIPQNPEDLADHLVVGHMLDGYIIPHNISLTHVITGEILIVPMPKKITSNNGSHNYQLLQSNEVIAGVLDHELNNEQTSKLVPVLENYHIGEIRYYLLRHPKENDHKAILFCEFIEECLKAAMTKNN